MLANRATETGYRAVEPTVDFYRSHWTNLVKNGLPDGTLNGVSFEALVERDRRNRAIIFNTDVDKVWDQLKPLIGEEMGAEMRHILQNQEVETL
jgi:hypothetical protein